MRVIIDLVQLCLLVFMLSHLREHTNISGSARISGWYENRLYGQCRPFDSTPYTYRMCRKCDFAGELSSLGMEV